MITFEPMGEESFQRYCEQAIRAYAEDHIRGGRWTPDEAYEKSAEEFRTLLPQGVATPDHFIYDLVEGEGRQAVGMLWLNTQQRGGERQVFIYEVEIYEPFRRRGYAAQAFALLDEWARERGASAIRLHVFGHNHAARALYEKAGYEPTNIQMIKRLDAKAG